jgi:endonuclease/exonuclease/phosphatase (EEP) superfamily protein YafD
MHSDAPGQIRETCSKVCKRLIVLAVLSSTVVTLASLFGRFNWILELLTHFRLQMVIGTLCAAVLAVALRSWRSFVVLIALAGINLGFLAGYVFPSSSSVQAQPATFRVLSANVSKRNSDYAALHALVNDLKPDVIGLIEVDERWIQSLSIIESSYPYRILRPEDGAYGLAIFSRIPFRETDVSPYREVGVQTAILAEIALGDSRATLAFAHLMAPTSRAKSAMRNRQLEFLAGHFRESETPERILLGDLNITPWSPHYAVLETDTGLANASLGSGYAGTWPTWPAFMRIPIDHCLVSRGLQIVRIRSGPDIGSDHLPLIVDIAVANYGHRVNSDE